MEDIWNASHESHADTFACTMHACQETKRDPLTSDAILIFYDHNLHKKIGHLNLSRENIQFQKTNHPKQSPRSEVMIVLKSTKFQRFSGNGRLVFKISSKIYLDIFHYRKIKWMCRHINGSYTSSYT